MASIKVSRKTCNLTLKTASLCAKAPGVKRYVTHNYGWLLFFRFSNNADHSAWRTLNIMRPENYLFLLIKLFIFRIKVSKKQYLILETKSLDLVLGKPTTRGSAAAGTPTSWEPAASPSTSEVILAEISLRSPRKLFIFYYLKK